jgi:hypothetical protein
MAQTFVPPTSSPTGFWNATPTASAPSGGPDWPNQAYLGIRMSGVSWGLAIETSGPPVYPADPTLDFSGVDAYTNHGGNFLYTFLRVPTWANSSHTVYMAPSDIDTATDCQWISATPVTDCTFKVFVTYFMQHICPTPWPSSTCKIRNFEAWNEFSSNGYWDDTWQHLATMAEDASIIVREKCSNCQFGMGSVSAGGLGWNDSETNNRDSAHPHWTYYDEALGDVLKDWKSDMATKTGLQEPDFISWHAYSAYNTDYTGGPLSPQPMPESSVSGDGTGSGGNNGDYYCSTANESTITNKYCSESVLTQATKTIPGIIADPANGVQGKAIWVTEGGFDDLVSMSNSDNNDSSHTTPKAICTGAYDPACTADVIRSAYLARWLVLLRYSGVNRAYWYSWDQPCFGTLFGMGTKDSYGYVECTTTYGAPTVYNVYNTKTRAGNTWDQVQLWLNGASIPTGCIENTTTHIYSCTITRTNPSGYVGYIVWYTPWLQTTSYTPPTGYTQYRTVDNPNPVAYSGGSITLGAEPVIFEKKS